MNRTIVITGGSMGIGKAAARALRSMQQDGARLAITGRSSATAEVANAIGCDYFLADYSKLSDVRTLAARLLDAYPRIDVLANNVGGIIDERQVTTDGNERTLQVNHLGGFLLTRLLQDRLIKSKAIVINTSSAAHLIGKVDLDDLHAESNYSPMHAYANAKLMNVLHAAELTRRTRGKIRGVSFHPGPVATGFAREASGLVRFLYESPLKHLFLISPQRGADTLVWLANAKEDEFKPGGYYVKRKQRRTNPLARDAKLAARLWDVSERLVSTV
jgi:NAD(P)-dependent dehydrogenase (short-subunit alcohol dehydrogenase family)